MNIYRFIVSKNSCVYWGQEAYLTLIQCRLLFSYEEASKAWNKQLTTLINLYRWSITFYHYLLNAIKLSNLKKNKETNKLTSNSLRRRSCQKNCHMYFSLLGPSTLLGWSAKKLECDKGKLNEEIGLNYMSIIGRSDK